MSKMSSFLLLTAVAVGVTGAACSTEGGASADDSRTAGEQTEGSAATRLATAEFRVDGMTCGGCALATELSVKKLDGVASVDAEYDEATEEGRCTVEYDPAVVSTERVAAAIRDAGFTPTLKRASGSG